MRHRFTVAVALLSAAVCLAAAGLTGCKPGDPAPVPHEHEYGDWVQGPETHWWECSICHEKFAEATHTYRNVVGQSYTLYNSESAATPILKVSAEGDPSEILIKEVWVCSGSEKASLSISYSTRSDGTFAGSVEIPVGSYGWVKAAGEFPGGGLLLSTYSYFRLQASDDDMIVQEIVFLASREGEEENLFLLTPALFDATGQEGNRRKALIDAQQFPNEKRECYVCHYPEPKAEK